MPIVVEFSDMSSIVVSRIVKNTLLEEHWDPPILKFNKRSSNKVWQEWVRAVKTFNRRIRMNPDWRNTLPHSTLVEKWRKRELSPLKGKDIENTILANKFKHELIPTLTYLEWVSSYNGDMDWEELINDLMDDTKYVSLLINAKLLDRLAYKLIEVSKEESYKEYEEHEEDTEGEVDERE